MIKYTKSKKQDLKELVEIDKIASKEISWWDHLSYKKFLEIHNNFSIYVAKDDNKIIGYLSTKKKKTEKDFIFLESIFILKKYRKKYIAKNLIDFFLKDNNKYNIKLHAPRRLEKFYIKFGFKTRNIMMIKESITKK